jgi:hypothetical protein
MTPDRARIPRTRPAARSGPAIAIDQPVRIAPLAIAATLALTLTTAPRLYAQASDIPSGAPPSASLNGQSSEQRGRQLLDQMVTALGGDAWLNRKTVELDGRTSMFFRGAPDPGVTDYHELIRFAANGQPEVDRIGFLTERGVIMPGKKIDVVQIWTQGHGYELTYKGKTDLPKEQVEDYYRRRAHSIEEVIHSWIHAPGVMIVYEGATMVERRQADQVSILSADNDAVTIEIDATTHLPLRRTFQWRNLQFKDHDEDVEQYDDYHTVQGLPTAMTITRYRNGDMSKQIYITKAIYDPTIDPNLFDPTQILKKTH